jgi:SP family galactose:H+ symporter-like MFS transporter
MVLLETHSLAGFIMHKIFIYRVALVAALAGLLFGLDIGVISGALPFLHQDLQLSMSAESWVVSSVLFSAAVGAIVSGWLSSYWGRKNSILLSAILFGVASLGSGFAKNYEFLIIMRILLGFSVGVATYNAPIYISEIAPANIRGRLVTFYQLMIRVGIVLAFFSDYIFTPSGNWRMMLGIISVPAFIMVLLVLSLPKSPRWLMLNGFHEQAQAVLKKLVSPTEYETSLSELEASARHKESLMSLLRKKPFLTVVGFGIILQMIQQFSGMNGILYFAPEMFAHAGFASHTDQMWATFLIGLVNMISTIFALRIVETMGRRKVLYLSGGMILVSTIILALIFTFNHHVSQFTGELSLLVIFFFIIGFALGYGPIISTLCSEVFPLNGRAFAMSCATTANWTANGLIGALTLPLISNMGIGNYFFLLAGFAVVSLVYFRLFVPETKQVSLEHLEANLWKKVPLRDIGN